MHTRLLVGRDHSEDISVDGRIILKWIMWEVLGGVGWICLALDRDCWHALLNIVMSLRLYKRWLISRLTDRTLSSLPRTLLHGVSFTCSPDSAFSAPSVLVLISFNYYIKSRTSFRVLPWQCESQSIKLSRYMEDYIVASCCGI
jgi:hypothetical protein